MELFVVLILFMHRQFSHLPDDGCGIESSLPFTFDEILLHLSTNRGVDIFVKGCVTRYPKTEVFIITLCYFNTMIVNILLMQIESLSKKQ
jgi:hypothetical protein